MTPCFISIFLRCILAITQRHTLTFSFALLDSYWSQSCQRGETCHLPSYTYISEGNIVQYEWKSERIVERKRQLFLGCKKRKSASFSRKYTETTSSLQAWVWQHMQLKHRHLSCWRQLMSAWLAERSHSASSGLKVQIIEIYSQPTHPCSSIIVW